MRNAPPGRKTESRGPACRGRSTDATSLPPMGRSPHTVLQKLLQRNFPYRSAPSITDQPLVRPNAENSIKMRIQPKRPEKNDTSVKRALKMKRRVVKDCSIERH